MIRRRCSTAILFSVGIVIALSACTKKNNGSAPTPISTATSTPTPTPTPPTPLLTAITPLDYMHVDVTFSKPMDAASVYTLENYALTPEKPAGQGIALALLNDDHTLIHLTTSVALLPMQYTLTVNNLESEAHGVVPPGTTGEFTGTGKVIFVSNGTGTGNLSSWTNAGGAAGLAAADNVCQAEAAAVNLIGTFKAWMSSTTVDAKDRIGANTKGWIRTDGYTFTTSLTGLTTSPFLAYVPVDRKANGSRLDVTDSTTAWTHTLKSGLKAGTSTSNDCSDWTSASGSSVVVGSTAGIFDVWTNSGTTANCSSTLHVYCVQTGDDGPTVPSFAVAGKKAFISTTVGRGDLSKWSGASPQTGILAGDAVCQTRAQVAGLANYAKFKAWLSDSTTNAIDRFTYDGVWTMTNGVQVASGKAELASGRLFAPIILNESIGISSTLVWTGTDRYGVKTATTCSDWSNATAGSQGMNGTSTLSTHEWTEDLVYTCDYNGRALYCFEDE